MKVFIGDNFQVTLSSVRSVFICSLAVSDILMSLTSLPITAVSIFTRDWVFPKIVCKLIGVFQVSGILDLLNLNFSL